MLDIKLNQTAIKAFSKDEYCPLQLKSMYVDKTHTLKVNEYMLRGQYFETQCIGLGAQGQKTMDLPRLKNGNKGVDHQRIDKQINNFGNVLKEYKMKIDQKQVEYRFPIEVEGKNVILFGTADFISSIEDTKLGLQPKAIVDLKLTSSLYKQFGDYSWYFPHNMDHTQAYMYTMLHELIHDERLPFYYMVFDYKPAPEHKIIRKTVEEMEIREVKESIRSTVAKINHHNDTTWDTNSNYNNCKDCPLEKACKDYNPIKPIQVC